MEFFYFLLFGALSAVVAALELSKNNKDRIHTSSVFNDFKNNYLLIYSLMMGKLRSVISFSFLIWVFFILCCMYCNVALLLDLDIQIELD